MTQFSNQVTNLYRIECEMCIKNNLFEKSKEISIKMTEKNPSEISVLLLRLKILLNAYSLESEEERINCRE